MRCAQLAWSAVVLEVRDLERALAHYRDRLGFEIVFVHEGFYAGVQRDGCRLHLKQVAHDVPVEVRTDHEGSIDACFGVHALEALAAEFARSGADFVVPLRQMPYGSEFYLCDPDGHVLAFVETAMD
ncbi:MAG TPA: VOC family protein [Rhodanobacteraceae bacterium]|nr:VOC family protein [Rhodanobacteraceae bacterium]